MEARSAMSTQELQLCQALVQLPARHRYRYEKEAAQELLENLFWSLAGGREEYMRLFFPDGERHLAAAKRGRASWKLSEAQGAVDGAEYTESARGLPCGHIFRAGEATYACRTCSTDDTCCLCSRCFAATDHSGHMVRVSISPGNSGCCDCGDPEAWKVPMYCTIHSEFEGVEDDEKDGRRPAVRSKSTKGKEKEAGSSLPGDLVDNIRMTIGRVFDYMCDVISCSPEQLRQTKSVESVEQDERTSRLKSTYYGGDKEPASEYSLLLWNDEKHTVNEVRDQVARACGIRKEEGMARALETDSVGRSILAYSESITHLLDIARIIEQIKVTVTIRSSRDTFREQMVGTMVEWLCDIAGCRVGSDNSILRVVICQEMLKPWREGSAARSASAFSGSIDDEEMIAMQKDPPNLIIGQTRFLQQLIAQVRTEIAAAPDTDDDVDVADADMGDGDNRSVSSEGEEGEEDEQDEDLDDAMLLDDRPEGAGGDVNMSDWRGDQALEGDEATMAGYPPPPPPPPTRRRSIRDRDVTPSDSDTAEPLIAPTACAKANVDIPRTPGTGPGGSTPPPRPGRYWMVTPAAYTRRENVPVAEDVLQRVRLDWLILFDVRMWKKVRNDLRSLYISTVVSIPEFKRVLGLRFASLYTTLAQLYLIGDREPDHSIINLSLQMLTTPSITAEIVERGNFLTNLMAILYTFLTTRQVGHPWDVSSSAVLAFDSGTVTNRRMYHFFQDLKYLFGSPHVQERLRTVREYTMQFLDLVKLHQGICPNVRAVGEHVEYETDTWISASLITREINRLCRQYAESFKGLRGDDVQLVFEPLRLVAKTVIINSIGAERARFSQAEIKDEVRFKTLGDFEFESEATRYEVVKFIVEEQPISFHHALHYTLSWLIEHGRSMPPEQLRNLLSFTSQQLLEQPRSMGRKQMPRRELLPEDYLMAAFDYPLRVCAWLAQMKANMWVRNGISLRHQSGTYRGVGARDVSHQRDIFLLQTALVTCDPSRVLASIVDRFGLEKWVKGFFEQKSRGQDDNQHIDVVEDMIHLLIVLLSDRTALIPAEDEPNAAIVAMRRDIAHVLCFKPLSFNDICNKLPDRYQEQEDFHAVLNDMATYKAPEGVSDVGTFELKPHHVEDIDPFIAHYNKNQREEADAAYRKWMSRKTGRTMEEIVYEPKLRPIPSGAFVGLSRVTSTGMFAQVIYYSLLYPLLAAKLTPSVPFTRVESFLHVVLHLILIAVSEDRSDENDMTEESLQSFVYVALTRNARSSLMQEAPQARTIVALLDMMSTREELRSCHAKVALILKRMRQKRPRNFESAYMRLGVSVDRINTSSPASTANADEERERKKKAAMDRQARVMAQFQQQQKSFLESQGANIDWGIDDSEDEDEAAGAEATEERKKMWKFPSGTCILCQEETDDRRLYGTFAFFCESQILRQTDLQDPDFVREAANTPVNLDRSAEDLRPFGVAHENRRMVEKINSEGKTVVEEQQVIGKGFPWQLARPGPVSIGCGHMMHFSCFEMYVDATMRRHQHQIARHHPEDLDRLEFVCPLCKALGNAFLPIAWRPKEESYPGILNASNSHGTFSEFLEGEMQGAVYALGAARPPDGVTARLGDYIFRNMVGGLSERASELIEEAWATPSPSDRSATPNFADSFSANAEVAAAVVRAGQAGGGAAAVAAAAAVGASAAGGAVAGQNDRSNSRNMVRELVTVYRRLRDTFAKNYIPSAHPIDVPRETDDELWGSDVLARAVGFSISAAEIQQRGVEAQYGATLLERIPEQVLTHLRILCETASSYIAVGGMHHGGDSRVDVEHRRDSECQHVQLFVAEYFNRETDNVRQPAAVYPPLLRQDIFVFLCEAVFGVAAARNMDLHHLVRLCYLAELVKVVYHMGRNIPVTVWFDCLVNANTTDERLVNFARFCLVVTQAGIQHQALRGGDRATTTATSASSDDGAASEQKNEGFNQPGLNTLQGYYSFVGKYALAFLRKVTILLHVKGGVDFSSHVSPNPDDDELARLTETLRLPTLDEMCASLTPHAGRCGWPEAKSGKLVTGWIKHDVDWQAAVSVDDQGRYGINPLSSKAPAAVGPSMGSSRNTTSASLAPANMVATGTSPATPPLPRSAMLSHPGIFELLGLPRNYDTLIEECARRRCPTTGKDLTDPMLCLTCGDVFCAQTVCCLATEPTPRGQPVRRIGGTQLHLRRCHKNVGLFISIRKCCVFYCHRTSGSWGHAPYIDRYGEVDMGLRHNRQLFLNQRRYDSMLRSLWLSHGVPSYVARRLESDINNGGWETI